MSMDGLELIGCILAALSIFTASTYVLADEVRYRLDQRHREQEKKEAEKWKQKR